MTVEEQLAEVPCPRCGHRTLTLEERDERRLFARRLGTWSLSGTQPKVSAVDATVRWPYAVCTTPDCGFEKRATVVDRRTDR